MLDYQRIVDDVRSTLHTANAESVDFLRAAAADYLLACEQVNDRLRRSGNLLRQGLRSEALQLCEIEPNLLDVVAQLDFPERDQWTRVLSRYGVAAPPPPLMLDVAAELNQAYALEQPLSALLERHRLLALARCPLPMRVNVLREIAQADAGNPIWLEDLQVFEKERLRQIQQEASDSAQAGDVATLTALDAELSNEAWLELPPTSLTRWVAGARHRLEGTQAMSDLAFFADRLGAASTDGDLAASRHWRDRYRDRLAESGLAEVGPLDERLAPALEWLAEQDELDAHQAEHDAAVTTLETALRAGLPADRLSQLYEAAARHGHDVPQHVENRYRARLAAARASRRWRVALVSSTIVAGLAVTVAIVGGIVIERRHAREVAAQAVVLTDLIESGQWDEADGVLKGLTSSAPRVATSPDVQALRKRLQDARDAVEQRVADFESALAQATAAGPRDADRAALARAEELAATDEERRRLADFQRQVAADARRRQEERDEQFQSGLSAFEARIVDLEGDAEMNPAELPARIKQLRADLKAHEQLCQPSPAVIREAKELVARLDQVELDARRRAGEERSEDQLTRAIGVGSRFRQALDEFRMAYPDTARGRDYALVVDEAALWEGVAKWNALTVDWRETAIHRLNPAAANARRTEAEALLAAHGDFPRADSLRQALPYLQAIARRTDAKGERLDASLQRIVAEPLVARLWMIELANGARYYLSQPPEVEQGKERITFKYIIGLDGSEKGTSVATVDIAAHGEAPQNELAAEISERLGSLTDANWDSSMLAIARRIGDDARTDPILRTVLLKAVLKVGTQGSLSVESALSGHSRTLAVARVDGFTNWLNPRREGLKADQDVAADLLQGLPDFAAAEAALARQHEILETPVAAEYRWIGWLRKSAGEWRCRTDVRTDGTGELFVVRRTSENAVMLAPVGRLAEGVPTIDKTASELLEGRPIFLQAP